jgi:hypothetical protein
MVLALVLAFVSGETAPTGLDLGWSVLAGIAGGIGITALYRGLAVGRMGVVAPVTGVVAALIPVTAGIILEGLPPPLVLVGIAAAVIAVVLVSRVRDEGTGPSGIELALVARSARSAPSPRATGTPWAAGRHPWLSPADRRAVVRPGPPGVRAASRAAIGVVGLLDMIGNGAFSWRSGRWLSRPSCRRCRHYRDPGHDLPRERVTRTHLGIALHDRHRLYRGRDDLRSAGSRGRPGVGRVGM